MTLLEAVSAYLAAESLMREPCAYETAAALVLLRADGCGSSRTTTSRRNAS